MAKGREIAAQESAPPPPLAVFAQAVILELPAGGGGVGGSSRRIANSRAYNDDFPSGFLSLSSNLCSYNCFFRR